MGRTQAAAMAEEPIDERTKLLWHLQHNHYPPIHRVFVETALDALDAARRGKWQWKIHLPNGKVLTVASIVEQLHLEEFI